jgi:hypothetical protein
VIGVVKEGYEREFMIAGLALRLDSLLVQWAELPEITARVAQQWDKQMNWLQYRWWLIGAAGILLLLGMMWFAFRGGQSTTGPCSQIVNQADKADIKCDFGTSK